MAILHVLSVRDDKIGFGRPAFVPSVGLGIRSFGDEVNRPGAENEMVKHPADFALFELGTFDDQTGLFCCLDVPKLLVQGMNVVEGRSVMPTPVMPTPGADMAAMDYPRRGYGG